MTVPLFRAGLARSACEVNCVVKQSAARTHRSELTGSIVRRRRNPLALARGGGQWRINSLVSKGILVKSLGDFAQRIRVLGNAGTHDSISLTELDELRLFVQLFLQYVFTLPAMIPDESLSD